LPLALRFLRFVACRKSRRFAGGNVERLSDRSLSALAQRALKVRAADWKHAETEHFIYHFFDRPTASAVSVEAEFYYRVIAKELNRDTANWERKCHVFIFDQDADWAAFQTGGGLDPWTGGLHADGTLFFRRNPGWRANNQTLPHENHASRDAPLLWQRHPAVAARRLRRICRLPLRAAFYRARGYSAKPRSSVVNAPDYIPLTNFLTLAAYPTAQEAVMAFYAESEKLTGFSAARTKTPS
jgi:hypothetical protein